MAGSYSRIAPDGAAAALSLPELSAELQSAVDSAQAEGAAVGFIVVGVDENATPADAPTLEFVVSLLRAIEGAGAAQAFLVERRLLLVLPYEEAHAPLVLCEAYRAAATTLGPFDERVSRPITLSVGIVYLDGSGPALPPAAAMAKAAARARAASDAGGDRILDTDPRPRPVSVQAEPPVSAPAPAPEPPAPPRAPAPPPGPSLEAVELERARAELTALKSELARLQAVGATDDAQRAQQLERRLRKLLAAYNETEGELRRVKAARSIDAGIASIHKEVQGLSASEDAYAQKLGLMRSIFEANVELQQPPRRDSA